ncbi:MAG: HEPN domain-containing protein [Gammaproteobacteria bacterium]|nr:HEPN domain-containing protein [Gammaproteobacteria bacterium]
MVSKTFDVGAWVDGLAAGLGVLAKAQEPYLHAYWQHNPRKFVFVDGRDATPFPLDDLRMVYAQALHSRTLREETLYAPLCQQLATVRHALLSHPELERVAVAGRIIGENNFWLQILNSGTSISAGDLIAGLMARSTEVSSDGFRAAARELHAFLLSVGNGEASGLLGSLDEGCDALLFYGLNLSEVFNVEEGMTILPFGEVQRFVGQDLLQELAPAAAYGSRSRSVGAVVKPFRWRPAFRQKGSMNEPMKHPPGPFFRQARTFLDLIAISHEAPVLALATIGDCIDHSAARLLGIAGPSPVTYQKWAADGFDWSNCPIIKSTAFNEAREVFRKRQSAHYPRLAPFVARLAEALGRDGRFAMRDKVLDVAIALEGMYELPKRRKSSILENRVSDFLATNADDREHIKERTRAFYKVRSEIVHSGSGATAPFRLEAAFVTGFRLARRSLFKLLRAGPPNDWENLADSSN